MSEKVLTHCVCCGAPEDDKGICTRKKCKRRKMQLKLAKVQKQVEKEREKAKAGPDTK